MMREASIATIATETDPVVVLRVVVTRSDLFDLIVDKSARGKIWNLMRSSL